MPKSSLCFLPESAIFSERTRPIYQAEEIERTLTPPRVFLRGREKVLGPGKSPVHAHLRCEMTHLRTEQRQRAPASSAKC